METEFSISPHPQNGFCCVATFVVCFCHTAWGRAGGELLETLANTPGWWSYFRGELLFWLAIVFSVCHGSLLPYRRTNYLSQTIQCSLETIGFYGHNLILYISIFLKLWKSSQLFFSKQCSFSRLMEKTAWIEYFFFNFSFWGKRVSCVNPAYIFVQAFLHCVLSISGKEYFMWGVLSSGVVLQVPDS